jgi:DNA-binding NarL/FixJ family response regulator
MIRVLIADDQALVRAGFRMILEAAGDMTVVGEAENGLQALALIEQHSPDVVLMDIRMPELDGLEATRRVRASRTAPPHVLILTTFDTDEFVYEALKAGAAGFLLKTAPPARLVDAIRVVNTGEALMAPSVTRRLIEAYVQRPSPGTTHGILNKLTAREQEVLKLIASGLSNNEIAEHLVLSQATVKTHINRLFAKLGVRDRVHAVVLAYQTGLVPSDTVTR